MTEWEVCGVIAAIVSLGVAIVAPIVKLTRAIASLEETVRGTALQLAELKSDNAGSHRRLWEKNREQDDKLNNHELRLSVLEHGKGEKIC